jgi:RES domain-containing protein
VYLASSVSLAALELLVHVDPEDAPSDLVILEVLLPAHAIIESLDAVAWAKVGGWRDHATPPPEGQEVGDRWVRRGETLGLVVPSVIIPSEENLLLNPVHPHMADVRVVSVTRFQFDPRLLLG